MAFPTSLKELCTPASLYFIISMVGLFIVLMQNLGYSDSYHVGSFLVAFQALLLSLLLN